MKKMNRIAAATLLLSAVGLMAGRGEAKVKKDAYAPAIDPANFQAVVDHPYFPLVPGTVFRLSEREGKRVSANVITVMRETKVILGVTCTVVHDVVEDHGAVKEDTYDW